MTVSMLLTLLAGGLIAWEVATPFLPSKESRKLAALGVKPSSSSFVAPLALLSTSALALSIVATGHGDPAANTGLAVAVVTVAALLIGYRQWIDSRREISLDAYYSRLDMADRRLESWPQAQDMLRHFWGGGVDKREFERFNYVYVELDNLEYVLQKYSLGYISATHALRGVRTFESRCDAADFRALVPRAAAVTAGYHPTTHRLALRLCERGKELNGRDDR